VHPGYRPPFLSYEALVFRRAAQTSDQTVDLPAAQQRIQARRNHTGAATAQLELVLVFPEHIPGLNAGVARSETDRIGDILQALTPPKHRDALSRLAAIIAGKRLV